MSIGPLRNQLDADSEGMDAHDPYLNDTSDQVRA